jgi:hypothetical protein
MNENTCCICIEGPNKKESIRLISCGCNCAWFHRSCETEWIYSMNDEIPYKCPTCRRIVPMKTNYSFSYDAGDEQKFLWKVGYCMSAEILVLFMKKTLWVLPCQSILIVSMPFMLPTYQNVSFYLMNVHLRILTNGFLLITGIAESDLLILIGSMHIWVLIFLSLLWIRWNRDPLEPYAISREIMHRKEDMFSLVAQAAASSLKRNKPRTKKSVGSRS